MAGEQAYPMLIGQAANDGRIASGHTVNLKVGANTPFDNDLTFNRPGVLYRPYLSQKPILRSSGYGITVSADNVTFRNLEITSMPASRVSADAGSFPTDIHLLSLGVYGKYVTFEGCFIHDCYTGVFVAPNADGFTMRDCVIWNSGWEAPDRGHGHSLYIQNNGVVPHVIDNCILGMSFGWGFHMYGSNSPLIGVHVERMIHLDAEFLAGTGTVNPLDDLIINNSVFFNVGMDLGGNCDPDGLGTPRPNVGSLTLTNNLHGANGLSIRSCWQSVTNTNNTVRTLSYNGAADIRVFACSTPGKVAHISVFNWQQADTVTVDVSGLGMTNGATYRLRNAFDPLGDVKLFTYDGSGNLALSFLNRSVAIPLGYNQALIALDKRNGAWIVETT